MISFLLSILKISHLNLLLGGLCLLSVNAQALESIVSKPQIIVDNKTYRLHITTKAANCGLEAEEHWPDGQPSFTLGTTDSFSIETKLVKVEQIIADWNGTWKWPTSKSCGKGGKDTCITPHERKVQREESLVIGENLKIEITEPNRKKIKVSTNHNHKGVTKVKGVLYVSAAPGNIIKPVLSKPHHKAVMNPTLCAEVRVPSYLAAKIIVTIIRRHP
jgi:hypothetical protein